jgi:F420-dependent oxidoreductase-like protein
LGSKFGIFAPQGWRRDLSEIKDPIEQYEAMTTVAKVADEGAWDSIWVYDHFHTVPVPALEPTFECWTATATLVRDTHRVNVGQLVGCNGYRNPALYAKIASTVDVASHGRLYAGIGAGWYEHEWRAYGYEWFDTPVRMRRFREAVQIIHKMWIEDYPTFEGEHYRIDRPINEPKGVRKPHPMFWIGGKGEKVTLRLVAQYGDACNINDEPEEIARRLEILRGHCDAVGRDYEEITRSSEIYVHLIEQGNDPVRATAAFRRETPYEDFARQYIVGTPADVAEKVESLNAVGIDYVIMYVAGVAYEPDLVRLLDAEVVRQFA